MSSLTRWVLAHKKTVVIFWVALTLVGVVASGPATKAMDQKFTVPGREGWETNVSIADKYGTGGDTLPLLPVVTLPKGKTVDSPGVKAQLAKVDAALEKALPGARYASYASTGDRAFVSDDGSTVFALFYPRPDPDSQFGDNPDAAKAATAAVQDVEVGGAPVHLTGFDALSNDSGAGNEGPGVLLETLVGGLGALIVLVFVFASFLAIVPIMMAVVSILTTFLLVGGLTLVTDISPIVQFLIALVGLGIAIDYSLLVVARWREERSQGYSDEEAVERAMATAGRAVVFSGTTVAIGLLALVAMPVPFLRSMGYAGVLIPLVSTFSALTLLPVVLAKAGKRLDWPHRRTEGRASAAWTRWAELVVRHRVIAAGAATLILGVLIVAASGLQLGIASADTIAKEGDAKVGLTQLEQSGIGAGALAPDEVLVEGGGDPDPIAAQMDKLDGVHGAVAPDTQGWRLDGTSEVIAFPTADGSEPAAKTTLEEVRSVAHANGARVGGAAAENVDFTDAVYSGFPLMIALITVVTFILLARAFRSLLLPLKAVILNVASVAAAWGVLVLVWQHGYGSEAIWGIEATGSIPVWLPLMVFAFLYGLSMDYEVFILSRVREEYDRTGDTNTAVVRGIGRTGRLVTSAALILFLAFAAMASGPGTDIKMFATGLAAGILLDATVIRALLVPAAVSLFGRWNWILPSWPARVLRVKPSLPAAAATGDAEG